ncbi:MAG: S41 family peptidase [Chloroflexota bacterium]
MKRLFSLVVVIALLAVAGTLFAQDLTPAAPPAPIANDEGGVTRIVGEATYTPFSVGIIYEEPVVLLSSIAALIDRDLAAFNDIEDQILGRFTSDFFTPPFTFAVDLPLDPVGDSRDVDNDGEDDAGVQVYRLDVGQNFINDSYLERLEQNGVLITSLQSGLIFPEINGGTVLVYAPDDTQGFPSGFGDDGRLFTEDDPIVTLPAGYTVVTLDSDPFTFDRSREAVINASEIELTAAPDFSDLGYVEAFNSLIDLLIERYSYTEFRDIDWEAIRARYAPLVETFDGQPAEVYSLLVDIAYTIRDAHVTADIDPEAISQPAITSIAFEYVVPFQANIGIGLAETDTGEIVVAEIAADSPAAESGIVVGDIVVSADGEAMTDRIESAPLWPNFPGTAETLRLAQVRNALQFAMGETVSVTYIDADTGEEATVELTADLYELTYGLTSILLTALQPEMPVTYEVTDGYGYVKVEGFTRTTTSMTIWEDFIREMNEFEIPGIIIDMRGNGGGSGGMANLMTSYLFTEAAPYISDTASFIYDEESGAIVQAPDVEIPVYAPAPDAAYTGEVVVLVDDGCASACEFMAYALQSSGRATIVGQYATAGAGGAVNVAELPGGLRFSYTYTRELESVDGPPIIEGRGVVPDVRVPVTADTLRAVAASEDPVRDAGAAELRAR